MIHGSMELANRVRRLECVLHMRKSVQNIPYMAGME